MFYPISKEERQRIADKQFKQFLYHGLFLMLFFGLLYILEQNGYTLRSMLSFMPDLIMFMASCMQVLIFFAVILGFILLAC